MFLGFLIFFLLIFLLFRAFGAEESAIWACLTVCCDSESFLALLAVLQLTRQGLLLCVHVPCDIVSLPIRAFIFTPLLALIVLALLDLSQCLLLLSLPLLLLGCSFDTLLVVTMFNCFAIRGCLMVLLLSSFPLTTLIVCRDLSSGYIIRGEKVSESGLRPPDLIVCCSSSCPGATLEREIWQRVIVRALLSLSGYK